MGRDVTLEQPLRGARGLVVAVACLLAAGGGAHAEQLLYSLDIPDGQGGVLQQSRINEAWETGEYFIDYPGGGPQLAMDTVEYNFGIPIDHYVLMDWVDFMEIINEVGGVDINGPEYAYDPAYSTCA